MRRSVFLFALIASFALWGVAQAPGNAGINAFQHSEFGVQYFGAFTRNVSNSTYTHTATDSGGGFVNYQYRFNHWEGIQLEYGFTRNGQIFTTAATPSTTYYITSDLNEYLINDVIATPKMADFKPFVVVGGGAIDFIPRSNASVPVTHQTVGAFSYGIGVDFVIDHIGTRVEYQGLLFKEPNFGVPVLNVSQWQHLAEPSVGLVFTF